MQDNFMKKKKFVFWRKKLRQPTVPNHSFDLIWFDSILFVQYFVVQDKKYADANWTFDKEKEGKSKQATKTFSVISVVFYSNFYFALHTNSLTSPKWIKAPILQRYQSLSQNGKTICCTVFRL